MNQLTGVRIAVTRAATQARELAAPLESAGATVFVCPLIKVETLTEREATHRVLRELPAYAWIVFTSVNGVEQFMRVLISNGVAADSLSAQRIACVGPATGAACRRYGLTPTSIPETHVGAALPDAMLAGGIAGQKILIARASGGGMALPALLRERGALVEDLELYRSVLNDEGARRLSGLVKAGKLDMVTFTSGSAATYFVQTAGITAKLAIAVIGPSTAEVARNLGLRVEIVAGTHTIAGLVTSIVEYYAAQRGSWRSDAGE